MRIGVFRHVVAGTEGFPCACIAERQCQPCPCLRGEGDLCFQAMNHFISTLVVIGLGYAAAEILGELFSPARPRRKPKPNTEPLSREKRRAVWKRDLGLCAYCGTHVPFKRAHIDHRNPRVNGGSNRMRNLATACASC